jgi:hypothetical protein
MPDHPPLGTIRCLGCGQEYSEPPPEWACPECGGAVSQLAGIIHVDDADHPLPPDHAARRRPTPDHPRGAGVPARRGPGGRYPWRGRTTQTQAGDTTWRTTVPGAVPSRPGVDPGRPKRVKVRSPDRLLDDLEIPVPRQTKILGVANLMILEKHGPSYQQRPGDKSQKAEAA